MVHRAEPLPVALPGTPPASGCCRFEPRPVEHFGWLGPMFAFDVPTTSEKTRLLLGWQLVQADLQADLDQPRCFA